MKTEAKHQNDRDLFDLTGIRIGNIIVVKLHNELNIKKERLWVCRCDCGETFLKETYPLKRGQTKSCKSCWKKSNKIKGMKHGLRHTSEYKCWQAMKYRCKNPNVKAYSRYGGRGISVCSRWDSFELFYIDMGPRPSKSHSIERINNDGNYSPENCKWALPKEQGNNKSTTQKMEAFGEVKTLSEWANDPRCNVTYDNIRDRYKKKMWSGEVILTEVTLKIKKYKNNTR